MIPKKIIVHHSLTKDGLTVSWGAIRKYHIETLGWSDIGYHLGCELVKTGREGTVECFMGRPWDIPGAHTRGYNMDSLGFCFVGNYDLEEPSEDILISGAKIIRYWMRLFDISIDEIYPHRYFADYKSCPGNLFDMAKFKEKVENYV